MRTVLSKGSGLSGGSFVLICGGSARFVGPQFQKCDLLRGECRRVAMRTGDGEAGRLLVGLTSCHMEHSDSFPTNTGVSEGDNRLHANIVPCIRAVLRGRACYSRMNSRISGLTTLSESSDGTTGFGKGNRLRESGVGSDKAGSHSRRLKFTQIRSDWM